MKKLLLVTILISGISFGQKFKLTPDNLRNISDSKDYIVIEFPNKNKHELFVEAKKTVKAINSTMSSFYSDRYSEIENEQITFNVLGNNSKLIMLNFSGANIYYVYNKYELNFKDGKIMVKPEFLYLTNKELNQEFFSSLMNRKESKQEKAFTLVDSDTNLFIEEFKKHLSKTINSDW